MSPFLLIWLNKVLCIVFVKLQLILRKPNERVHKAYIRVTCVHRQLREIWDCRDEIDLIKEQQRIDDKLLWDPPVLKTYNAIRIDVFLHSL